MKLIQLLSACTLFGALAGSAVAIPYASKITVSSSVYTSPFSVSYMLNEPADSVTIEILNGSTAVATFAGTATQGANQVIWDGTANNAGGTAVADGNYTVRITANKNRSAWEEVASQRSLGNGGAGWGPGGAIHNQAFDGFSPVDFLYVQDTNSDFFGYGLGYSSYGTGTPDHVGALMFNSDLSVVDGAAALGDRVFKVAGIADADILNGSIWSGAPDPDNPDAFYWTGQHSGGGYYTGLHYGDLNDPENLTNSDPTNLIVNVPRSLTVTKEGADKFAYFIHGNSTIRKAQIDTSTNQVMNAGNIITSFATTNRYGKQVEQDAAGNIYFVSKHLAAGNDGIILRWSAAAVAGANPATPLSEANADWQITYDTSMASLMGISISPNGDVHALFVGPAGTALGRGIYYVGNTSTPALVKTLSAADKVYSLASDNYNTGLTPNNGWVISDLYSGIHSDPVGNLVVWDRNQEQVRLFAPPVNSSEAIDAPASQAFTIGEVSEPKNPVIVDAAGGGDYLTVNEAIASWCAGGENASGTAPFTATAPFVIKVRPSTGPYDEALILAETVPGKGDIVGDIVIESEVPGTPAVLKLKNHPDAVTAGNNDGFFIQQSTHDVTFRDLVFTYSISDTAVTPLDELVLIEEGGANSDMNLFSFYNCIFTEVGTDGEPMIMNKSSAFNAPPARGGPTRAVGARMFQYDNAPDQSSQVIVDNCVFYAGSSSNFLARNDGAGAEFVKIHNSISTWAGYNAFEVGGANPNARVEITGEDHTGGLMGGTVAFNPLAAGHGILITGTAAGHQTEVSNTILYSQGTASTPAGAAGSRGISGGNSTLTLRDSLIYVPNWAIVDTSHSDMLIENTTIVTPTNAVYYTGTATGGKLTIRDSILAGAGTKISAAPPGGVEIFNSAFPTAGAHAIGAIGGGTPTTTGLIQADPMFISTDATLATFLDVDNAAYATAASDNGPLSGGADYVGSSDVSDWSVY